VNARALVVAIAVVTIGASGCSSHPAAKVPPGTLPAGTAELSLNGAKPQATNAVQCQSIGWMRTIKTGHEDSGASVMLSNANKLVAEFVRFHDFDGFTGSYDRDFQGEATVTMTGPTYRIKGTATGYADAKPTERTTEPFELTVSC
jgi:ipoprotein LpqH